MKRRLFKVVAALSLLLCVATVALWARSYWTRDCLSWRSPAGPPVHSLWVLTGRGGILFNCGRYTPSLAGGSISKKSPRERRFWVATGGDPYYPYVLRDTIIKGAGFEVSEQSNRVGTFVRSQLNVVVPLWSAALLFATVPALVLVRGIRARRQLREGSCNSCGYDLRATPERCPECGAVPVGQ